MTTLLDKPIQKTIFFEKLNYLNIGDRAFIRLEDIVTNQELEVVVRKDTKDYFCLIESNNFNVPSIYSNLDKVKLLDTLDYINETSYKYKEEIMNVMKLNESIESFLNEEYPMTEIDGEGLFSLDLEDPELTNKVLTILHIDEIMDSFKVEKEHQDEVNAKIEAGENIAPVEINLDNYVVALRKIRNAVVDYYVKDSDRNYFNIAPEERSQAITRAHWDMTDKLSEFTGIIDDNIFQVNPDAV